MSLFNADLYASRQIIQAVISPIEGKLEALEDNVKEIYSVLSDLQKNPESNNFLHKENFGVEL